MSVNDLKSQIINRITDIEDELVLREIIKLINFETEIESVYQLSDAEKKSIDEGLKDIKEGRVYSSEDADMMMNKWLKR